MGNIWLDTYKKRKDELNKLCKELNYKGSYAEVPLTEMGSLLVGTAEEVKKLQSEVNKLNSELNTTKAELKNALILRGWGSEL